MTFSGDGIRTVTVYRYGRGMRVGIVILPEYRWWVARPKWEGAEEYGFDHAWTYDHVGWGSLVDGPWFGAVPTLTAAAAATSTIHLGTFVVSPNFRHPVPFVREVTALDDISDGRFLLGVGAGTTSYDARVLGGPQLSPGERVDRLGEFLHLLDALLTQDRTTWRGEHYAVVDGRGAPGSVRRPRLPFLVAANDPRSMQLVAQFGHGWITNGAPSARDDLDAWWRSVRELSARLDEILVAAGREPATVDRYLSLDASPLYSLSSVACFTDMVSRAAELGFTDVVAHWPRSDGIYAGRESVLETVAMEALPLLRGWPVT